jgi:hypothetical protein
MCEIAGHRIGVFHIPAGDVWYPSPFLASLVPSLQRMIIPTSIAEDYFITKTDLKRL